MAPSALDRLGIWVQRRFRRLRKSSLAVHSSVVVSDLSRTLAFYKRLGFRRVSATRSDEITLLRNRSGAELNLIRQQVAEMPAAHARSSATVPVANLDKTMTHLRRRGIEIASGPFTGPTSRWFIVHDPDANQIEFFQTVARGDAQSALFHLVTGQELAAGITDAYYLPPEAEKRFVYCRTGSAILLVAATNLRKQVEEDLILVQLDPSAVSLAPTLHSDFDIDKSVAVNDISTYPDVYSPIDIDAISGAAKLPSNAGSFQWPERFGSLASVLA